MLCGVRCACVQRKCACVWATVFILVDLERSASKMARSYLHNTAKALHAISDAFTQYKYMHSTYAHREPQARKAKSATQPTAI